MNWFKEKYYFPDSQELIQNIINEYYLAKTEHRDTKLTYFIFNTWPFSLARDK